MTRRSQPRGSQPRRSQPPRSRATQSEPIARSSGSWQPGWWRPIVFVTVLLALQALWRTPTARTWDAWVVGVLMVKPLVWLIRYLSPELEAHASGARIEALGGGIEISPGCDGLDAQFLLLAGVVILPIPWNRKLASALVGIVLFYLFNQARLLTLFYVLHTEPVWFPVLHTVLFPFAIVATLMLYLYRWLGSDGPENAQG